MTTDTQIAIVGGGIGGLCLAQGLRRAGVRATVYERDRTPADRLQGYRVHIDPDGATALHECLPPDLWSAFLVTGGKGGQDLGFLTERLERLLVVPTPHHDDPTRNHHSVSRITLRQILLSGLDDTVRFGATFERYEHTPEGRLLLRFAGGDTAEADILVGADGGNSRVRRQYLPHAERVDTGIITVAGKFPLTAETRASIPPRLREGPNLVLPPAGAGLFCAPHDLGDTPVVLPGGIGATEREGALYDNTGSYIMWALGADRGRLPEDIATLDGERLRATAAEVTRDWHPDLVRLVTMADPATVSLLPIRTSVPIGPWPATRITLLGDAVHSMTPMRGVGANIALRDARLLCRALTDGGDPVTAIGRYEEEMRGYGFAAVRASLRAARQFVGTNRLARRGFRAVLRTTGRLQTLRNRIAA